MLKTNDITTELIKSLMHSVFKNVTLKPNFKKIYRFFQYVIVERIFGNINLFKSWSKELSSFFQGLSLWHSAVYTFRHVYIK